VTDPAQKLRNFMESVMDLTNNAVGLKIGVQNANAGDDALKKACLEALQTGQLVELDDKTQKLVPTKSIVP
jgi:hypothetical protein